MEPYQIFKTTYSDETEFNWDEFDVDWFCDIKNADVAQARLDFLRSPGNIYKLRHHGFAGPALERMWRSVLRACVGYSIPLTSTQTHMAQELGIILPR